MKTEFIYEPMDSLQQVREAIKACEGRHVQQVAYSSFMGSLTQVCFTCQRIRGTIEWNGNRSWNREKGTTPAVVGQCLYEARTRDGSPAGVHGGADPWCRTHGWDCPNSKVSV